MFPGGIFRCTYYLCYRSRIGEENVFLPFSMNLRGAYSHFLHYWQKLYLRCLAASVGEVHFIQATLFPEAAALLHGARLFSLSLFHLLLQGSYVEKLCQSTRALVLVFISDCLHPIWLRCTFNHVFTLQQNCLGTRSRHAAVEHATCALQKYLFDFLPSSIIQ